MEADSSYRNREVNDGLRPQSLGFKNWASALTQLWLIKACFRVGRRKIITDFCCIFDGSLPEIDTDQVEARFGFERVCRDMPHVQEISRVCQFCETKLGLSAGWNCWERCEECWSGWRIFLVPYVARAARCFSRCSINWITGTSWLPGPG